MRALLPLAALLLIAAAPAAPPPPPPASDPNAARALFGGPEPGDEEEAEGAAEPAPAAPTAPPSAPSTQVYDARVRQSFAAAQAFQGRLDGGWIVSWRDKDLMQLQLADKGKGEIEGAWRDLRAGAGLNASGLLDPTAVKDGAIDAVFGPEGRGARAYRLTLRPAASGALDGTLRAYDEVFDVTARRAR